VVRSGAVRGDGVARLPGACGHERGCGLALRCVQRRGAVGRTGSCAVARRGVVGRVASCGAGCRGVSWRCARAADL